VYLTASCLSIPNLVLMYNRDMDTETLANILLVLRNGLHQLLGDRLHAVYLYGSRARGDAHPDSDIDVLIVLKDDFDYGEMLDLTIDLVADLSLQHDVVISRAFVSMERFEHESSPFLMNVRREAIPA
ncbi:MAG TPA: nucleotidyltransferase domain-containing protein, partial [Anaerolineales bacterium]|nr:nucleotidyltransferase domain-containing protein [Anaerolineales bacterium]